MADVELRAAPTVPEWSGAFERVLLGLGLAACASLFAYKVWLVDRLNINWDEFLYLSQVHALARGELYAVFQSAYAHLFGWLTSIGTDEVEQIASGRLVMLVLLGATAFMVWRLGRRWLEGFPSIIPPLAYLSMLPVLQHGGSFRADSLLAPLVIAAVLLIVGPRRERWRDVCAGALCGVALTVTLKSTLMLPMFLAIIASRELGHDGEWRARLLGGVGASARFALSCAFTAAILLWLHSLTIPTPPTEPVTAYGGRVASKMLLEVPWFAQGSVLQRYFSLQPLSWLLLALGAVAAVARREFTLAAFSLSLLPVAIYRNAFPYFYVVMLAPAVPLAGYAMQELRKSFRARSAAYALALFALVAAGIFYQTGAPVRRMWDDEQSHQRMLVSAVHGMFTEPVTYVDRCGMIATFRKANYFMSTWGLEEYRRRGQPFMQKALRERHPAFVLVNTPYLDPGTGGPYGLLPEDRRLIRDYYPVYWGPVRVAGAEGRLEGRKAVTLTVPFASRYRLTSDQPVRIRETIYRDGDVVDIPDGGLTLEVTVVAESAAGSRVALFLAEANPRPEASLPDVPIFTGL
jgi:hypothetical protein